AGIKDVQLVAPAGTLPSTCRGNANGKIPERRQKALTQSSRFDSDSVGFLTDGAQNHDIWFGWLWLAACQMNLGLATADRRQSTDSSNTLRFSGVVEVRDR